MKNTEIKHRKENTEIKKRQALHGSVMIAWNRLPYPARSIPSPRGEQQQNKESNQEHKCGGWMRSLRAVGGALRENWVLERVKASIPPLQAPSVQDGGLRGSSEGWNLFHLTSVYTRFKPGFQVAFCKPCTLVTCGWDGNHLILNNQIC